LTTHKDELTDEEQTWMNGLQVGLDIAIQAVGKVPPEILRVSPASDVVAALLASLEATKQFAPNLMPIYRLKMADD
jgi:hypothetical protein